MAERLGIVGLPNSGKSSLFNALTGGAAAVAAHPFTTTETSVGMAKVPDERVERLTEMSNSKKSVLATVELTDIAGLVAGSSTGEGLGNRFLGGLREADAILLMLRAFESDEAPPANDPPDPLADLSVLELELVLADAASVEQALLKRRKAVKAAKGEGDAAREAAALEKASVVLEAGTPLYRAGLSEDDQAALATSFLLTSKPVLAVVNVGEDQLDRAEELVAPVREELGATAQVLASCVQLEAEAASLDPESKTELLEGLGLGAGALPRVAKAAYDLLGRRTFLTTGDTESRAWTFRAGSKAPECAGVIHSDLQRGFIRADVIHFDELISIGSWSKAREMGKVRSEGKDYVVADGDVLEIRFNV
jgi:ribosome-binding ATPase